MRLQKGCDALQKKQHKDREAAGTWSEVCQLDPHYYVLRNRLLPRPALGTATLLIQAVTRALLTPHLQFPKGELAEQTQE